MQLLQVNFNHFIIVAGAVRGAVALCNGVIRRVSGDASQSQIYLGKDQTTANRTPSNSD